MPDTDKINLDDQAPHTAPLNSDTIPNANQSHFCLSCEAPITGLYCANCGQKNDDMRRSIFVLLTEVFASLTALESRIWRTWVTLLFKPGKVAREYADGRRTHWSSPVRVYLAMSLILFGFMNVTQTHLFSLDVDVQVRENITKPRAELTPKDLTFKASAHFLETQETIDQRNKERDFELINLKLSEGIDIDFGTEDEIRDVVNSENGNIENGNIDNKHIDNSAKKFPVSETQENGQTKSKPTEPLETPASDDIQSAINDVTTLMDNAQLSGEKLRLFFIDFLKNPVRVTQIFNVWLPRILFIMMPFTMLIGALFIRGKENALLYDHLVHAAYIHTVAFFFIFIGLILTRIIPEIDVAKPIFLLLAFYLPISLRRMFKRGWVKTIWTSYGVATLYLFIIFSALVFLFFYSLKINLV